MGKRALIGSLILILASCTPTPVTIATSTPTPTLPIATSTLTITPTQTQSPTPSPTPTCVETEGKIVSDEYPGVNVEGKVKILVYLPPCYGTIDKSYSTIYLLHGSPGNENYWLNFGIDKTADAQIQSGSIGFIMVMPNIPEPLFCSTDGGEWSYEAEFTKGLMPFIENKYRTILSSQSRTIAGISRGGIWALEIGLTHSDIFGQVVAFSPALSVNYPRPEYDIFFLVDNAKNLPKFLLVVGQTDWAKYDTSRLADFIATKQTSFEFEIVPGEHEPKTWIEAIPIMFDFLFP